MLARDAGSGLLEKHMKGISPVLWIVLLALSRAEAQQHSLRFFGNGTGQIDRVKVPIDAPHRPADVGGDFTVELWIKGSAAENGGVVTAQANGDGCITGNVIIDRDVFNNGDHGDWGIAVFHIGNSFMRWGDVPAQLANFAASRAQPHVWGNQIRDGEGLGYHWANGLPGGLWTRGTPSRTELATGTWDALVLQPQSREWLLENQAAFLANADLFDNLADANGTRIFLYAYWPYLSETVDTQDAINAAFESVRTELSTDGPPVRIIPAGEAFRRVAQEVAAGTLAGITRAGLYQDDLHPGDEGYYLSALVHYATIHQQNPSGLPAVGISADPESGAPAAIDPDLAAELQRIAWDVARGFPASGITRGRFDAWAAANLPPGPREPGDVPFGDGIYNLARWAFGIPASSRSGAGFLPQISPSAAGMIEISYQLGPDAEDAGVLIAPQWSMDLSSWDHPAPAGLEILRSGQTVTLRFPKSQGPYFMRMMVGLPW